MYNLYKGNSGKVKRVDDEQKKETHLPAKPKNQTPGAHASGQTKSPFSNLLPKSFGELETEDLLLVLILYLMYRESGDKDLLIIMGGLFLL